MQKLLSLILFNAMAKTTSRKTIKSNVNYKETCFLISPIGEIGSEKHEVFAEVLEYVVKPAVENSGFNLKVVRADEIKKPGSIIKEILENLVNSNIVIADLTTQNPNVFYELGVRHALSPRTILIAQSTDDIPFDLRDYRTIIYNTSARGASAFATTLKIYLEEINSSPDTPDNPVLDRIGFLEQNKIRQYQDEIDKLKQIVNGLIKKDGINRKSIPTSEISIKKRVDRILNLREGKREYSERAHFTRGTKPNQIDYSLPTTEGTFTLYYFFDRNSKYITGYWFLTVFEDQFKIEDVFAEIRILLEKCSKNQDVYIDIIIAANKMQVSKIIIKKMFTKVKSFIDVSKRKYFNLILWDEVALKEEEEKLGIRIKA